MTMRMRATRVGAALANIAEWRDNVKSQGATHLFPMIALIERGAGNPAGTPTLMNETPHEFEFWDKYFRLDDQNRDKPYFNPVTLRRAEAGFPHSNSATIRKNTFSGKWNAAHRGDSAEGEIWTLADNYADIFRDKVLTKNNQVSRVPVVDVAVLLLRNSDFPDNIDADSLVREFRSQFPQAEEDFDKIFSFQPEPADRIFTASNERQDYLSAIESVLVADVKHATGLPKRNSEASGLDLDDPVLVEVQRLMALGTSGCIFTGVPGTGKSYYAKRIATHLVNDPVTDIFRVQFHPSYGYEDFVEGYRPDETSQSGYKIVEKTFLIACRRASELRENNLLAVLIVDEINRGDPARVFGELLTYIERTYRDENFTLPFSGNSFSVPDNLIVFGTMNPFDRSISQMDAAFVRRFDHIEISPSREVAESLLERCGEFSPAQVAEIGAWFELVQRMVPFGIGHSFFADVQSMDHLKLVWKYRLRPTAMLAIELNDGAVGDLDESFEALLKRLEGAVDGA